MNAMLDPRIVAANTHGPTLGAQGDFASLDRITPSSHGCLIMLATVMCSFFLFASPDDGPCHPSSLLGSLAAVAGLGIGQKNEHCGVLSGKR